MIDRKFGSLSIRRPSMKQLRRLGLTLPLISLISASLACNMPATTSQSDANAAATATMQALATFVAQTLETGEPNQNAQPEESEASEPAAPTPSSTPSPTPTLTPTTTPTHTPAPPVVSVSIDTNCRFGLVMSTTT
jgi:outer membrane biosynthesis protein TonB